MSWDWNSKHPQKNDLLCWSHVTCEQRVPRSKHSKQLFFADTKNMFILISISTLDRCQLVPWNIYRFPCLKTCSAKIFPIRKEHNTTFSKSNSSLEEYCRDCFIFKAVYLLFMLTNISSTKMAFLVLYILLFSCWKCVDFDMLLTSTISRTQSLGKFDRPAQNWKKTPPIKRNKTYLHDDYLSTPADLHWSHRLFLHAWRHRNHFGVPKQCKLGHVGFLNQSCGS